MTRRSWVVRIVVGLFAVLALGPCTAVLARDASRAEPVPEDPIDAAIALVQEHYRRPVERSELVESALKGMLHALDPYSRYLNQEEWDAFHRDLAGSFAGIGVVMEADEATGRPKIAHFVAGSPAHAAGARIGDVFWEIEGQGTEGMSIDGARLLLPGKAGTSVHFQVLHQGTRAPVPLSVERREVKVPSVRGFRRDLSGCEDYFYDRNRRLGYVRIMNESAETVDELQAALTGLEADNVRGLVLDLRENGGGYVKAGVGAADLFLDSGTILTMRSREGVAESFAATPGVATRAPLVVLINGNTMSSAEILAGALQDHRRAVLLGERTYGKGYVGDLFPLKNGSGGVVLMVQSFQRPSGKTIDRHDAPKGSDWGVAPDPGMEMPIAGEEYDAWSGELYSRDAPIAPSDDDPFPSLPPAVQDRVLERGVEVLESVIRAHERDDRPEKTKSPGIPPRL